MTITTGPQIAISDVNNELGLGATYSSSLSFLNGYMKAPTASPNLAQFRGLAYYQRNQDGNCNNGNCVNNNCSPVTTNCACDCGAYCQAQCYATNCYAAQCSNCSAINCANCDTKSYIQSNCNCACSYACNCNTQIGYNCVPYNCTSYDCPPPDCSNCGNCG
jgi:hypothetical protein